jgi:FAD/FMN-containing dehydrogenase
VKYPDGIGNEAFAKALQEFADVVGAQWLFSHEEDLTLYEDSYTPFVDERDLQLLPSAAVAPANVEEVQQIVRIANTYKIPLHAISTGRNLGYGGAAPTYNGSVVVDLKRMNRILEVSESEAYVLLEPGVSFMDLYRYFEDHGLPFMVATPAPGWGSPIGNALEHGTSLVVGDNFAMACGLEVVLANGEILRTGMGASANSRLWQNYGYGFGPSLDGIFSQSNFGIVTKMGFWLVRKPEVTTFFTVSSFKSDDLHALVDIVQMLRQQGLTHSTFASSPIRAANNGMEDGPAENIAEVRALITRRDGGAPSDWEKLGKEKNIPVSSVAAHVRGPARVVEATLDYAKEAFSKIHGVTFRRGPVFRFPLDRSKLNPDELSFLGIPNLWAFSRLAVQGTSRGHYFFSPMLKATAADLFAFNETIHNVLIESGDAEMIERVGWRGADGFYPKAFMVLIEFLVTDDVALNRRRRDLFKNLVQACGAKGWCEYRTPAAFQDLVATQYSFNDNVLHRFHETIKDAIDPNGILAPGKAGIWPKDLRRDRP